MFLLLLKTKICVTEIRNMTNLKLIVYSESHCFQIQGTKNRKWEMISMEPLD